MVALAKLKKLITGAAGLFIALEAGLGFASTRAATRQVEQIYVFGDSLSDTGNGFEGSQGQFPPNPIYFRGRYSNGPVWVEYLAAKFSLDADAQTNFAYGGATTGREGTPPGLLAQVQHFVANPTAVDPKGLYLIWGGANDYLSGTTNTDGPVNNLVTAVQDLIAAGAKNIVVVNLPDLGQLPGTRTTERSQLLTQITQAHNTKLAAAVETLSQPSSDARVTYLDVGALFRQVIQAPQKFGFKNVTEPCLNQIRICQQPHQYLFWDEIHPTTAAHKLLVELATSTLKPVAPQSGFSGVTTAFVALFGALGTGLVLRRYQDTTSVKR